jgi:hypothetical protein
LYRALSDLTQWFKDYDRVDEAPHAEDFERRFGQYAECYPYTLSDELNACARLARLDGVLEAIAAIPSLRGLLELPGRIFSLEEVLGPTAVLDRHQELDDLMQNIMQNVSEREPNELDVLSHIHCELEILLRLAGLRAVKLQCAVGVKPVELDEEPIPEADGLKGRLHEHHAQRRRWCAEVEGGQAERTVLALTSDLSVLNAQLTRTHLQCVKWGQVEFADFQILLTTPSSRLATQSIEKQITTTLLTDLNRKLRRREKREPKRVLSYWVRHENKDARYRDMLSDYNVCALDTLRLEAELGMASKVAFAELRQELYHPVEHAEAGILLSGPAPTARPVAEFMTVPDTTSTTGLENLPVTSVTDSEREQQGGEGPHSVSTCLKLPRALFGGACGPSDLVVQHLSFEVAYEG